MDITMTCATLIESSLNGGRAISCDSKRNRQCGALVVNERLPVESNSSGGMAKRMELDGGKQEAKGGEI